jgi:hypothetical protein
MERLEPIHTVEYKLRRQGVFLLVDFSGRKLWFFGFKHDQNALKQMMADLTPRRDEMIKYLTARASVRGETK